MISFPPCKINLGLNVLRRRSDGYHEIDTCFYPLPFTDVLEVIPSEGLIFSSSGLAIPGNTDDNLCVKAFKLLADDMTLPPASIHLHKCIPAGAGLGGGSSDAAHTLRLVNDVFSLNLSEAQLMSYASKLGSDCSFFIQDHPMLGSGRGEVLTRCEVRMNGMYLVLLNPGLHISTAEAYAQLTPKVRSQSIREVLSLAPSDWKENLRNDFEETVFRKYPQIEQIKTDMYAAGALYASMSGSGSSVFGIFRELPRLNEKLNGWIIWQGRLTL